PQTFVAAYAIFFVHDRGAHAQVGELADDEVRGAPGAAALAPLSGTLDTELFGRHDLEPRAWQAEPRAQASAHDGERGRAALEIRPRCDGDGIVAAALQQLRQHLAATGGRCDYQLTHYGGRTQPAVHGIALGCISS